jgi:hypothetical protein
VRYEPASSLPREGGCQSGTLALGRAIKATYTELQTLSGPYGCYNRRKIAGASNWSLHAEGRALDIGVQESEGGQAWRLACELVAHRTTYGTMRVMWDRHIWSTEKPDQWRKLGASTNQHLDHIHVEQFRRAAAWPASSQVQMQAALAQSLV